MTACCIIVRLKTFTGTCVQGMCFQQAPHTVSPSPQVQLYQVRAAMHIEIC